MMIKILRVPPSLLEGIDEFLNAEQIALKPVGEGDHDAAIRSSESRQECVQTTLDCGGWITCERALAMASHLALTLPQMGKLLNHLQIKIRHCGLGCF